MISETTIIPANKMIDFALTNAKSVDPNVKEVRRGSRLVNGIRMSFAEYAGTVDNTPFVFYGHFYSDDAGTIQILGWTHRDMLESYRAKIDAFVSGFYLGRK